MLNSFRQGLISYTKDGFGAPQFLLPAPVHGRISLVVGSSPVLATFAHGAAEYLLAFDATVLGAWQLVPGEDNYLFWDVDLLTADLSYGITTLKPIVSSVEPPGPAHGQHWFDLGSTTTRVWFAGGSWGAGRWVPRIRLFAGLVRGGNPSAIVHREAGSQAGLVGQHEAGYIMLDSQLHPIRTSTGEFLTTGTRVMARTTAGTSGVLVTPLNAFISVRAGEHLPAMSLVYISGDDEVSLAGPAHAPVGIVREPLARNEIGTLVQAGLVEYDQWSWMTPGQALYCGEGGQLTADQVGARVGTVKSRHAVLFNIVGSDAAP